MKLSDIKKWLAKDVSDTGMSCLIFDEIARYSRVLQKRGTAASITLVEDGEVIIGEKDVDFIFSSKLKEVELDYIVNAMLLCETVKIQNEQLLERLEMLLDSDIN